jgi:hypothetical protein
MPIRRTNKTRKNCKKNKRDCHKDAKKGTQLKCRLKTCRAKKYQAVYGAATGGSIRASRQLFY